MGVREDIICDDFKTVPIPYLNSNSEYEEINCGGYDLNGVLRLHDLVDCEGSYECTSWDTDNINYGDYDEPRMTSTTRCGINPQLFSHCSQCKICTPIDATSIQVRNLRLIFVTED